MEMYKYLFVVLQTQQVMFGCAGFLFIEVEGTPRTSYAPLRVWSTQGKGLWIGSYLGRVAQSSQDSSMLTIQWGEVSWSLLNECPAPKHPRWKPESYLMLSREIGSLPKEGPSEVIA